MTISPPKFDFKGDREKSIALKPQARQFYNFIINQAELGGLNSISRSVVLPDGSTISVYSKKDSITGLRTGKVIINTSRSKAGSVEELEALIIQLAADGAEEGWGKPYNITPGTPGGHNPWTIVKTDEEVTTITVSKGLDTSYFTNNDDVTYSLSPNTGNCYWGDTDDKIITWVGPYNQIGPINIDGDSSYGGTLSDVMFSNEGAVSVAIGSPSGKVYVSDNFNKNVFKDKKVIAEFSNYVLAACESTGDFGDCIVALTATSLNQKTGLHYKIEVFWISTSTIEVKLDIDMASGSALFPTYAGAFNLAATECSVVFYHTSINPSNIKLLKIDTANLNSISYTINPVPLPEGSGINKRLYGSIGYSTVTSVSTRSYLLSYGYDYSTDSLTFAYIIVSFDSYFSGGRYITSYLQIGSSSYLLGTLTEPHYSFNYTSLYGLSPFIGSWLYPDLGLYIFLPNLIYSNIQRGQLGVMYWSTTEAIDAAVPAGYFMPVRVSSHFLSISSDRMEVIGITADDYMTRHQLAGTSTDHWPLGSYNSYYNPIKTSFSTGSWITTGASNSLEGVRSCDIKINGVIPYSPGTASRLNYLQYKYLSVQHSYFNGVSHKKYSLGSFNLKGPFSWYYQTDYPFPMPSDYAGNFKAYLQAATDTTTVIPSGYKPIKDISGSLGMSSQTIPRIKRSRILPQVI